MPTPIGNLRDITLRALDVLGAVDLVACEDTRVTQRLMTAHGLARPRIAYHEHNAERIRPKLLGQLAAGARIALVSDAGTPLVSDPGYRLVRDAITAGIAVTALPGASSVTTALAVSGLPPDRFLFLGFLDRHSAKRRTAFEAVATVDATLILFEAAPRLAETLADAAAIFGARQASVARELTKRFEEVRRGALTDLARHYAEAGPPRGEIVVLIGPPDGAAPRDAGSWDAMLVDALARLSLRDAVEAVAAASGESRKRVYARALELARGAAKTR